MLMTDLKALYESLKFRDVITYIQSGNVIFRSDTKLGDAELAKQVEQALLKKYKFEVPVIIRSLEEVRRVIAVNPFLEEKGIDPEKLHVTFLSDVPEKAKVEAIAGADYPPDRFRILGKEVFVHCPISYGETKLSNKFFESKLKVSATTRNWNTVNKLAALAAGHED